MTKTGRGGVSLFRYSGIPMKLFSSTSRGLILTSVSLSPGGSDSGRKNRRPWIVWDLSISALKHLLTLCARRRSRIGRCSSTTSRSSGMLASLDPALERHPLVSRLRSRLSSRVIVSSMRSVNSVRRLLLTATASCSLLWSVWISAINSCSWSLLLVVIIYYVSQLSSPSSTGSFFPGNERGMAIHLLPPK